jgi:hypothetical protein
MSDWEDDLPISKKDLASLTNGELSALASINCFLSQMLGGRSAELHHMGQYQFASHSNLFKELGNHLEVAQFETECLKKMIINEEASRSKIATALTLYNDWFAVVCDGYFEALKSAAKGQGSFAYQDLRRQRKQSLKKWSNFKKSLEKACANEKEPETALGLPGIKLLCDMSTEERKTVKK